MLEAEKVIKIDPDLRLKNIIKGYETNNYSCKTNYRRILKKQTN